MAAGFRQEEAAPLLAISAQDAAALREQVLAPNLPALKALAIETADDGRTWVVMGVAGTACYSLRAPEWRDASSAGEPFIDVTLDIRH